MGTHFFLALCYWRTKNQTHTKQCPFAEGVGLVSRSGELSAVGKFVSKVFWSRTSMSQALTATNNGLFPFLVLVLGMELRAHAKHAKHVLYL